MRLNYWRNIKPLKFCDPDMSDIKQQQIRSKYPEQRLLVDSVRVCRADTGGRVASQHPLTCQLTEKKNCTVDFGRNYRFCWERLSLYRGS